MLDKGLAKVQNKQGHLLTSPIVFRLKIYSDAVDQGRIGIYYCLSNRNVFTSVPFVCVAST